MEHNRKTAVLKGNIKMKNGIPAHHSTPEIEYIENQEFKDIIKVKGTPFAGDYIFFDLEKHNPRTMNDETGRSDIASTKRFIQYLTDRIEDPALKQTLDTYMEEYIRVNKMTPTDDVIVSKFKSHGQVLFPMLKQIEEAKNGLVFLDEPETSLSPRSLYKMVNIFKQAERNGSQLFIATHSELLIKNVPQVLSLEHGKWMNPYEFLETQKIAIE